MVYFNERRVVEAVILPLSFIPVIAGGVGNHETVERDKVIALLKAGMDECLPTMDHKTYQRVFKRAREAVYEGFLKRAENAETLAVKAGLALYYFIDNMMRQGAYDIAEGSKFEQAMDEILPALEDVLHLHKLDQSAYKEGRRMLTRLHELGYYTDVKWITEFVDYAPTPLPETSGE